MPDADRRLTELETRAAFQERLIQELNEALTAQQKQLDELARQVAWLRRHAAGGETIRRPEEEIPPPHY